MVFGVNSQDNFLSRTMCYELQGRSERIAHSLFTALESNPGDAPLANVPLSDYELTQMLDYLHLLDCSRWEGQDLLPVIYRFDTENPYRQNPYDRMAADPRDGLFFQICPVDLNEPELTPVPNEARLLDVDECAELYLHLLNIPSAEFSSRPGVLTHHGQRWIDSLCGNMPELQQRPSPFM